MVANLEQYFYFRGDENKKRERSSPGGANLAKKNKQAEDVEQELYLISTNRHKDSIESSDDDENKLDQAAGGKPAHV